MLSYLGLFLGMMFAFLFETWRILRDPADSLSPYFRKVIPRSFAAAFVFLMTTLSMDTPSEEYFADSIEAFDSIVGYAASGATFLLVFQVSMGMARWKEARSHIGKVIVSMKFLRAVAAVQPACQGEPVSLAKRQAAFMKLLFHALRVCVDDLPLPTLKEAFNRMGIEADDPAQLGLEERHIEVWESVPAGPRVFILWHWLCQDMLRGHASTMHPGNHALLDMLDNISAMIKVKNYSEEMQNPITRFTTPFIDFTLNFYLPTFLARQSMNVTREKYDYLWSHPLILSTVTAWNVFPMSLVLTLWGVLHRFIINMDCPFGADPGDLHLAAFEVALCNELDIIEASSLPLATPKESATSV